MTEPRGLRRRRRPTDGSDIPQEIADWFAGKPRPDGKPEVPWAAILWPEYMLLRERWAAWVKDHPGAKPPQGFEEIAEPPPAMLHGMLYADALAQAKRQLAGPHRPRLRKWR